MDHSHAALVAEDDAQSSPPLGSSATPWFWYSGQRADPFAFATTEGKPKPRTKRVFGYGHAAERVLRVMREAAVNGECWLSVPSIATRADCSERTVQMSRRDLCADGLLVDTGRRSGSKYRNTRVYRLGQISPNVEVDKNIGFVDIESVDKTSADTLPHGHGEAHAAKPTAKANPLTPTAFAPSPDCAAPLPAPQKKAWPLALTNPERQQALIAEALWGTRDSKLVKAWKKAHLSAGLPPPTITAIQGAQLGQLARGKNALEYSEVERIIPCVIVHWPQFIGFCRRKHWVHGKSKAPLPADPSTGFLLRYKLLARLFCEMVQQEGEEFLWSCYDVETGPLPEKIPTPRFPKRWNSPIWAGHSPEHKKLSYEEMYAPSTWNAATEAETLEKLVEKGVPKNRAIAVLKYANYAWDDLHHAVKWEAGVIIQTEPHPHLLLEHWHVADAAFQRWWDEPTKLKKLLNKEDVIAKMKAVIGADFVPWWSAEEPQPTTMTMTLKSKIKVVTSAGGAL